MAIVALTQVQKNQLRTDTTFRQYLADSVISQAEFYLGLNDFNSQQNALNYAYSRFLRTNPSDPFNNPNLVDFMIIQMSVRGLANYDNTNGSDTITNQTITYLSGIGSPIGFIVSDYFAEKTKNY